MDYAILKTGGKQYQVGLGAVLDVEKLDADAGDTVELSEVLMLSLDGTLTIGTPTIEGAKVIGVVQTISPFFTPNARQAICSADVPLFVDIENLELQKLFIDFSNNFNTGPVVIKSDLNTFSTLLISLISILCLL